MQRDDQALISYHLAKDATGRAYARGFHPADTNDVKRLCRGIAGFVWSPIVWRDGVRRQENFLRADWCVLDFDNGEMTLDEACSVFCDAVHIIGTTKSHRKAKDGPPRDRFRVALLFEEPVTDLRLYRYNMKRIIARYPADPAPKDGARFFFPCVDIVQSAADGYTEELSPVPDQFERPNLARFRAYGAAGVMPGNVKAALTQVIPKGRRNVTWYGIAKDLARMGLKHEEICELIFKSPTCAGTDLDLVAEIQTCVQSGVNTVAKEIEDERNRGSEEAQ